MLHAIYQQIFTDIFRYIRFLCFYFYFLSFICFICNGRPKECAPDDCYCHPLAAECLHIISLPPPLFTRLFFSSYFLESDASRPADLIIFPRNRCVTRLVSAVVSSAAAARKSAIVRRPATDDIVPSTSCQSVADRSRQQSSNGPTPPAIGRKTANFCRISVRIFPTSKYSIPRPLLNQVKKKTKLLTLKNVNRYRHLDRFETV